MRNAAKPTHTIPASRDSTGATPTETQPRVTFWHWYMAQRYAIDLLLKFLRTLLLDKPRIP